MVQALWTRRRYAFPKKPFRLPFSPAALARSTRSQLSRRTSCGCIEKATQGSKYITRDTRETNAKSNKNQLFQNKKTETQQKSQKLLSTSIEAGPLGEDSSAKTADSLKTRHAAAAFARTWTTTATRKQRCNEQCNRHKYCTAKQARSSQS